MKVLKGGLFHQAMRHFRTVPGVVGLGFGLKTTRDGRSEMRALRVIVRQKRPFSDVALGERIPAYFEGVVTDVREPLVSVPAGGANTALIGGAGIHADRGFEGTLGCFATIDNGTKQVMLTAGHVLTDDIGAFAAGGVVGSPEVTCCCCCQGGVVANILRGQVDADLDCGIATLTGARPAQQVIRGLGPDSNGDNTDLITGVAPEHLDSTFHVMTPVVAGEHVRKVGARTGLTGGNIQAIDFKIPKVEDLPEMPHQIVIGPLEKEGKRLKDNRVHFTQLGDSGAVVVNDRNEIVGLLIRAADLSSQPNLPPWVGAGGVATNIHRVIEALGIDIYKSPLPPATQPIRGLRAGLSIHRAPAPMPDVLRRWELIDALKRELETFALGRMFVRFAQNHEQEIATLVNHDRRVTVAWHRAHGPTFLAMLLKELRSIDQPIPRAVENVPIEQGLASVYSALLARGSAELGADLAAIWPGISASLPESPTIRAAIDKLRGVDCHE